LCYGWNIPNFKAAPKKLIQTKQNKIILAGGILVWVRHILLICCGQQYVNNLCWIGWVDCVVDWYGEL
jgi:hypothetical protein